MPPVTVQFAAWTGAVRWGNRWLPACGLLTALAAVFLFSGERDYLYSDHIHSGFTAKNMALAENLSPERGFLFLNKRHRADGTVRYQLYNRFPIGAFVLIKLAIAPFAGDFAAQLVAARALMLAFFCAAAALAYLALARLSGSRAVALGATLLAFSSHHLLHWRDAVSNEVSVDLFAVTLVFHGMVLFHSAGSPRQAGGGRRFWQLAAKVCAALLFGWHVYGLLLPFLALGAATEAVAAWRGAANGAGARAARPLAGRVGTVALRVARGRSVLLGALALVFGSVVLGYNFAREYAAFDGHQAVADLPSVRSMLKQTGLQEPSYYRGREELEWSTFVRWQFHRVGVACVPIALAGGADLDEYAWRVSGGWWFSAVGVVATIGAFAGLALFRRPRAPAAALALAGFCWAFLVPGSTAWAAHQFESMFHVGVPLCLFAGLLLAMRRFSRQAPVFFAGGAVLVFFASSVALGSRRLDDEARSQRLEQRAEIAEFDAIAETIQGREVLVAAPIAALSTALTTASLVDFFMAGAFVHYADTAEIADPAAVGADFVLALERYRTPALLTPSHRFVFLYRAGASAGAVREAMRDGWRGEWRRRRALGLVARSGFNVHVVASGETRRGAGELAYLKAPCDLDDTQGRFYLHLVPVDANLASGATEMERRDFIFFNGHGVVFDDKCLMRLALPPWPVANVYTGQFHPAGDAASWRTAFRLDVERLRDVLHAVRGEAPLARGAFDLFYVPRHLRRDSRRGALRYVREPCTWDAVRRRFFLHVVPVAAAALPEARRRSGFANLDFDFGERGALVDGACVATVELPDYDIARVRTGQFEPGGGVAWRVELAPNAPADH